MGFLCLSLPKSAAPCLQIEFSFKTQFLIKLIFLCTRLKRDANLKFVGTRGARAWYVN